MKLRYRRFAPLTIALPYYLFVALSNESYFWPRPQADAAVLYSTVFCSVEHRILADFRQKCKFFHTYPLTFHKCDTIYTNRDGKEQKHSHIHKFSCLTPSLCLYPILLDSLMVKLQTVNLSDTGSSPVLTANIL